MPANHTYVFQVTVTHTGQEQDFTWFFNKRRQKMTSSAVTVSHSSTPLTASEKKPKTEENAAKKFIKLCLKKAGLKVSKQREFNGISIQKNGKSFRLYSSGYGGLNIDYFGNHLTTEYTTYEVYDGATKVREKKNKQNFNIFKPQDADALTEVLRKSFTPDKPTHPEDLDQD